MTDPISALDPASQRTLRAFIEASLGFSAAGMRTLLAEDCTFVGALSAGSLRGPAVIEAHIRHVFKSLSPGGSACLRTLEVQGRQVVFEWAILAPGLPASEPAPGRFTLLLDEAGLISRIKTEWNPKSLPRLGNQA